MGSLQNRFGSRAGPEIRTLSDFAGSGAGIALVGALANETFVVKVFVQRVPRCVLVFFKRLLVFGQSVIRLADEPATKRFRSGDGGETGAG